MVSFDESGYETPEEASSADIPARFVTILNSERGRQRHGLDADQRQPPFEAYQVDCVCQHGRWHADSGFPFDDDTPEEIVERARGLGWSEP